MITTENKETATKIKARRNCKRPRVPKTGGTIKKRVQLSKKESDTETIPEQ